MLESLYRRLQRNMDAYCGVKSFDCLNEAFDFIKDHEKANCCRYSIYNSKNWNYESLNVNIPSLKPYRIRWEDKLTVPNLPFDGTPFVILGTQVRHCVYGIDGAKKKRANHSCLKNSNTPMIWQKGVTEVPSSSNINYTEDSGHELKNSEFGFNEYKFRFNDSDMETYVIVNDVCEDGLHGSDLIDHCETVQVIDDSQVKVCELRTVNEEYVVVMKDSNMAEDLNIICNSPSVLDSHQVVSENSAMEMKLNLNDSNFAHIEGPSMEDSKSLVLCTQPVTSSVFPVVPTTISVTSKPVMNSSSSPSKSPMSTTNSNLPTTTEQSETKVLKYCSACIKIRVILQFPEYANPDLADTKWKREKYSKSLAAQFSPATKRKLKVYLYLPSSSEHTNHLTGKVANLHQEREKLIRERVSQFVINGVSKFKDIREHIQDFLNIEIGPKFSEISPDFPIDQMIKNEIKRTQHKKRFLQKRSRPVMEDVSTDNNVACGNKELVDETITDNSFLISHDYCREEVAHSRSEACFTTEKEANEFIKKHEIETNCTYPLSATRTRANLESLDSLERYRLRWGDTVVWPNIPPTGVPYVIVATQLRRCQHGPLVAARAEKIVKEMLHIPGKTRKKQESMKKGCMAYIKVRTIIRFPEYKISKDSNRLEREKVSRLLWKNFSTATEKKLEVYVSLPPVEDHSNHATGELANETQRLDKMMIEKIHEVVGYGVTNVKEMRVHLKIFFDKEISPMYPEANSSSRRFNPTDRDIRNHIILARQKLITTHGYDPFSNPSPAKCKREKKSPKPKKTIAN